MKVQGSAVLSAPPERVYAALHDPEVLVRTIPGVQRLERVSDDRYRMTVTAGVASITGSYDGEVALTGQEAPHAFVLKATGAGAPGTVDATVQVRLSEQDGGTRLEYDADAVVGGMVGGVGQRMLAGVARRTAGQFFTAVDDVLTGRSVQAASVPAQVAPPSEDAVVAAASGVAERAAPQVFSRPQPERSATAEDMRVPFWIVLAGVGAGAFWALAGVTVGWVIARKRG